jgi:hypothetical protein
VVAAVAAKMILESVVVQVVEVVAEQMVLLSKLRVPELLDKVMRVQLVSTGLAVAVVVAQVQPVVVLPVVAEMFRLLQEHQ